MSSTIEWLFVVKKSNLLLLTSKDLISIVTFEVAETDAIVGNYEGKKLVRSSACFTENASYYDFLTIWDGLFPEPEPAKVPDLFGTSASSSNSNIRA